MRDDGKTTLVFPTWLLAMEKTVEHDRKSLNDFLSFSAETLEVHRDVKCTHACKCC